MKRLVTVSDAMPLKTLEDKIGHQFKNPALLNEAVTHSSTGEESNYERLEFLGDRVVGLVIAEQLYARFPDEPEGHMAKRLAALVQGEMLASIAQEMDLGAYINFSDAEEAAGGAQNDNILADVFESIIGALYLDAGYEACQTVLLKLYDGRFDQMKAPPQHPKTSLQEWAQGQSFALPEYEITAQDGPDHAPEFEITLSVEGYPPMSARGRSRQQAEKEVALKFLESHVTS